jgi:flagellar basal body P-ring formation protein FlgA
MNSFDKSIGAVVLALLLASPARLAWGGEPGAYALVPEAKVDGSGIFLNQLVRPPPSATLPPLRLAPAPSVGQTTPLSRQQIIDLAKEAAPELDTTNWTGPNNVRVSRRTRQLAEMELVDMLRTALQRDYVGARGDLELHLTRPWAEVTVPDEPLALQLTELPPAGVMPNEVAGFELWCGKERIGAWQEPVAARVWHEVPVAHSPLARGELLRDADIALERRDVLEQHEACIRFPVSDDSLELKTSVSAGTPVWSRCAAARPLVRRGRLVEAVFQDGDLIISLKVETLEDGALGQTVRVMNPKTHRELLGKVQNEDLVLIAL